MLCIFAVKHTLFRLKFELYCGKKCCNNTILFFDEARNLWLKKNMKYEYKLSL